MLAAAARAMENPLLDVEQRFIGNVEDPPQIIAFVLVLVRGPNFLGFTWRINQVRNSCERLIGRSWTWAFWIVGMNSRFFHSSSRQFSTLGDS
jgi:hypothetical protein